MKQPLWGQSTALCTAVLIDNYFTAPKEASSGKEQIYIFIQTNVKIDWWSSFSWFAHMTSR